MLQRSGLDNLYAAALRRARAATDDAGEPRALPGACPFALGELLVGDVAAVVAKVGGGGA